MHKLLKHISVLIILFCMTSCTTFKMAFLNSPNIDDQKYFPQSIIPTNNPSELNLIKCVNFPLPSVKEVTKYEKKNYDLPLEAFLEETNSTAFLVMRNDSLLYENYFNGNKADKQNIVFSITKSFVTSLLAIAIDEGYIESLDQKVGDFIDTYKTGRKQNIKIRDVLQMTSGINQGDYSNPLKVSRTYYTSDLEKVTSKVKVTAVPGTKWEYKSIDTQLLGMIIESATGKEISALIQEKIWEPLGMEHNAYWTKDSEDGNERMYGGMTMTSRDILKFGKLILNKGNWNGQQIIPEQWITSLPKRTTEHGSWWGYNNGWWMETFLNDNHLDGNDMYASGFKGQYLYINPKNNLIIVRQGLSSGGMKWYSVLSHFSKLLNRESISEINVVDTPELFEGTYVAENGAQILVKRNEGNKWKITVITDGKKVRHDMLTHSALGLTNGWKLKIVLFDLENDKIKGLHFDKTISQPTYFKKQ